MSGLRNGPVHAAHGAPAAGVERALRALAEVSRWIAWTADADLPPAPHVGVRILRTPEAGSFLRGDWTGLRIPVKPLTPFRIEADHQSERGDARPASGRSRATCRASPVRRCANAAVAVRCLPHGNPLRPHTREPAGIGSSPVQRCYSRTVRRSLPPPSPLRGALPSRRTL